ncbi:MAG TPA: DUF2911 domain-containing protein [Longimicrobiales bacterium]|nr:DUF2911 domain-containing protein [Longimicrobiales bacterium]
MRWRTMAALLAAIPTGPAAAQTADSAAFVIRLGSDTVAVERYVRTADRLVVDAVQRSPSTMIHRFVYSTGPEGRITAGEWTVRRPGGGEPVMRREIRLGADSATLTTTDANGNRSQQVAVRDAIPMGGPFYTPYELAMMRAVASGTPKAEVAMLAGSNVVTIPVERVGRDSVALQNQFGEPMRAHVDERGRLLHLHTPAFTTVERTAWIDLDALAADFARRDESSQGLGMLSPRHAARTRVGDANIWLDYSRPAMRGRPIWGALVPWDAVWRMGANEAAHLATDRTIALGDLTLEPGTYTLFLLPAADRWTLIVNRATGISGLERDPAQDIGRVELTTETLERPVELFTVQVDGAAADARLAIAWDRTRASVPLRAR